MAKTPTTKVPTKKHLARAEKERRYNRIIIISAALVGALVIGLVIYGILDQYVLKQYKSVASVSGDRITVQEFQKQVRFNRSQMANRFTSYAQLYKAFAAQSPQMVSGIAQQLQQIQNDLTEANGQTVGQQVLTSLIERKIIEHKAKELGITISEAELDKRMQEAFNYFPNGTPTPTVTPTEAVTSTYSPLQMTAVAPTATVIPTGPTETPLPPTETPTLEPATPTPDPKATAAPVPSPTATATPYTIQGYQTVVADFLGKEKTANFGDTDLREYIRALALREKVQAALTKDTPISEEQVWAHHILVKDQTEAQKIYDRLKAGEDWAIIADEMNQDKSGDKRAEDLGWFGRGKMVKEFEDAAFKMQPGEISQPVKSQFGWHIIQVLGHETRPLTAAEFKSARDTKFQEWLRTQKDNTDVQQYDLWMSVVPTDPTIPANQLLDFSQQNQQQQLPNLQPTP